MGKRLLKGKNCLKNSKEKGGESILLGKERKCIASLEVWEIHYAELQTMFASSSLLRCVHGGFLVFFSLFLSFSRQTLFFSGAHGDLWLLSLCWELVCTHTACTELCQDWGALHAGCEQSLGGEGLWAGNSWDLCMRVALSCGLSITGVAWCS